MAKFLSRAKALRGVARRAGVPGLLKIQPLGIGHVLVVLHEAIGFVLPGLFYLKLQPESAPFSPTSASTGERCVLPRPVLNNVAALTMVLVGMVGAVWGVISAVG